MHDKSLSPSLISGLCGVSFFFNQPPVPLRTDTPQSPQLPLQSPSPPDYSPTEVGRGGRAGPLKAGTRLEPLSCPLFCAVLSPHNSIPSSDMSLFAL